MINKIISTKCIGYNKDYSQRHYQSEVIMISGEQKTLYETTYMISGFIMKEGFTKIKPRIEVPLNFSTDVWGCSVSDL